MGITHFEQEMMNIKREVDEVRTVREQLLTEMRIGKYREGKRLPRETVLSEELGISRTQLRDTLAGLEQEGYITRKLGVGTIINRHVLNVKSRMDIEAEILDIIRNNGYEPKIYFLDASEEKADERVKELEDLMTMKTKQTMDKLNDLIAKIQETKESDECELLRKMEERIEILRNGQEKLIRQIKEKRKVRNSP